MTKIHKRLPARSWLRSPACEAGFFVGGRKVSRSAKTGMLRPSWGGLRDTGWIHSPASGAARIGSWGYRLRQGRRSFIADSCATVENAELNDLDASILENADTDIARRFSHLRNRALSNANGLGELRLGAFAPKEVSQLNFFHDDFSIRNLSKY
ncbi:hypothetical protein [Pseudomonas putida]|uniref:hypothetical protein n=1 Tax=Pseudomonas putida TaxID=303 RepID=UPI003F5D52F3